MSDQPILSQPPPGPNFWNDLISLYREFKICRFSLIVTFLGLLVFVFVPQGVELLRSLGEESTFHILGSGTPAAVKWVAIGLATLTWALASWYACRVLLYFDFSADQGDGRPPGRWWRWLRPHLREQLPRVLGVTPLVIMAIGFWHASGTYDDPAARAPWWLHAYSAIYLLSAVILYAFFVYRRVIWRLPALSAVDLGNRGTNNRSVRSLPRGTRVALIGMTVVSVVLTLLFMIDPIFFGGGMGSAAVLLFAAGCWVFWGSVAVYLFARYHVPVLTLAVAVVALFSLWNDNHFVRTAPPSGVVRAKLGEAFGAWHANIGKYAQEPVHPLFIVATEGGGIRAAYWTATVLATLEDRSADTHLPDGSINPHPADFSEHVFAISAVSGGSLGAAVFDAALAGGHDGAVSARLQSLLGEDFLAPPLAAMLYPDLVQRFLFFPVARLDRGQWLERAWERAGRQTLGNDRLAQNFNDLWTTTDARKGYQPALFLNGTSVETGQRIIASNLVVDHGFLDSVDASEKVAVGNGKNCDIPLSTAAHGSARFTYVSPAGRFADGTHIVDGGYFENSGATTALEILRAVEKIISTQDIKDVRPYVIFISNDPLSSPNGGRDLKRKDASVKLDRDKHQPGSFLEDALAPVWALLNTRDAHNSYAQLGLQEAQDYQNDFFFGLSPSHTPLPLGWKLSGTAAQEMNRQVLESGALIDGKNNPQSFHDVLSLLNGLTPITPYYRPPESPMRGP